LAEPDCGLDLIRRIQRGEQRMVRPGGRGGLEAGECSLDIAGAEIEQGKCPDRPRCGQRELMLGGIPEALLSTRMTLATVARHRREPAEEGTQMMRGPGPLAGV